MHRNNSQQNKLHLHGYNLTQLNNEISNACNNLYSPSQSGLEIPNPVNHWTRIAVMIFMRKAVTCYGPTIGKIYRGSNRKHCFECNSQPFLIPYGCELYDRENGIATQNRYDCFGCTIW